MTELSRKTHYRALQNVACLVCVVLLAACDAPLDIQVTTAAETRDVDAAWQACLKVGGTPSGAHMNGLVFGVGNAYTYVMGAYTGNTYFRAEDGKADDGTPGEVIGLYPQDRGWLSRDIGPQAATLASASAVLCSRESYKLVGTCATEDPGKRPAQDQIRIVAHVTLFAWPSKSLLAEDTLTAEPGGCGQTDWKFGDLKLRDWLSKYR